MPAEPGSGARRVAGLLREAARLAWAAAAGLLLAFLALTLAAAALPVATAWLTRSVIDALAVQAPAGDLLTLGSALAILGVLAAAVPAGLRYLRAVQERAIALVAKQRLFEAIGEIKGLRRFEDPEFLDRLEMADESGGRGPNQLIDGATGVVASALTVLGFLGTLLAVSPAMAVIVLVSGVPLLAGELALSRKRARTYWEITPGERRELFYRNLLATQSAAKEVRLFGLGAFLRGRMLAERRAGDAIELRMDRRELRVQSLLGVFSAVVSGAGLVWAVVAARANAHSIGDIALFVAGVIGVQAALAVLAQQVARVHEALLLFEHYVQVLRAGPDLPRAETPRPVRPLRRGIELRDVWFRYSGEHPWVLRGVDLTIPAGAAVALAGRNGAGKSTIVKLVCRFYDPVRGSITWDGVDLRELDVDALRRRISAVFQDYVEYEMTAAENIGVGRLEALDDIDRIRTAARRAGIDDFLSNLPHGYATMLSRHFTQADGGAGFDLSGGQRQRIALARAFVRDEPDLVILDEPSSGLDAAAEHQIHRGLTEHRAGRTSLLISHRLNAVRQADLIVTLDGGVVAEQGSHDALTAAGGLYAELFRLQSAGYRDGE